jgi:16S rRNA (cytidine1402-2'-O)-methyltransferase
MKGILYLIPATIGESPIAKSIPDYNRKITGNLKHFVVENVRSARRFLKKLIPEISIDELNILELNEHTPPDEIPALLSPLLDGHDIGLLSEAGLPCVADPGALLVRMAHENKIKVCPLTGPSSVFLALMGSGFNGQNFTFHGYLPIDKKERVKSIKTLEQLAYQNDQTQIFIETPYRNLQLLEALIQTCKAHTCICLAVNLTTTDELITVMTTEDWKRAKWPDIHKKPAVFLLYH